MDQCVYWKVSDSDDILLASNDKGFMYEVKQFLSKKFDMKDMGNVSYVIVIKIFIIKVSWVCPKKPISIEF